MPCRITKRFAFSASFETLGKFAAHNYILEVTTPFLDEPEEKTLSAHVDQLLIRKVHTKDFGLHVDFLKSVSPTDENLLKVFWRILEPGVRPVKLLSLALRRDQNTRSTFSPDA